MDIIMRRSKIRYLSKTARGSLDSNDDASDTAESRLHADQSLILVMIECFRGNNQRNQIMTRKSLHLKSQGDEDVVKASLSRKITLYYFFPTLHSDTQCNFKAIEFVELPFSSKPTAVKLL